MARAHGAKLGHRLSGLGAFAGAVRRRRDPHLVGTQSGLLRFDGHALEHGDAPTIPAGDQYTNDILDARGDAQRGLWVATFGGISRLLHGAWSTHTPSSSGLPSPIVLTLHETRAAHGGLELVAGMRNGLARFTGNDWALIDEPGALTKNEVTITESTAPDGSPVLWVATSDAGVFARDHGKWAHYARSNSPLAENEVLQVRTVKAPGGERLFVSTGEAGLAYLDPNAPGSVWTRLTTKTTPALPDNCVYGVVQDHEGRLYACTNHGVARLASRADGAYDIQISRTEDGLPSEECNTGGLAIDPRGRIWAGTLRGAAVLDPDEERDDGTPKRLILREARLFEQPVDLTRRAVLSHDESTLAFDFALVSYHREAETGTAPSSSVSRPLRRRGRATPRSALPASLPVTTSFASGGATMRGSSRRPWSSPSGSSRRRGERGGRTLRNRARAGVIASGVRLREANLKKQARDLEERIAARTLSWLASIKEFDRKNRALVESHQRADRIFSALEPTSSPAASSTASTGSKRRSAPAGSARSFVPSRWPLAERRGEDLPPVRGERLGPRARSLPARGDEHMLGAPSERDPDLRFGDLGRSGSRTWSWSLLQAAVAPAELRRSRGWMALGRVLTIGVRRCAEGLAVAHAAADRPSRHQAGQHLPPEDQRGGGREAARFSDRQAPRRRRCARSTRPPARPLLGTPRYMAPERLARTL